MGGLKSEKKRTPKSELRDRGVLKRATRNANQSAAAVFTWSKVPKAAWSGFGPPVMVQPTNSLSVRINFLLKFRITWLKVKSMRCLASQMGIVNANIN